MMDGVVVIDKPSGMTSHDVVDRVRKVLKTRKVGHAGTLDPDATGLLLLGVGRATRFLSYAQEGPKRYLASARFGSSTTTQDAAGEILEEHPVGIDRDDVERELKTFVGSIEQIPPMVSAVRVGGERLYKKALRGEEVQRNARIVSIHRFDLIEFKGGDRVEARFDIACSAGTFVRTLIHDLGATLGCGAHMTKLRRTEAGGFTERDAVALDDVSRDSLRPLADVVACLPRIELTEEQSIDVRHGRPLQIEADVEGPVALVREGHLCGVYKRNGDRLVADRVLSA